MRANFFVMFPVATMPDVPATYISASFRAPETAGFDNALVRAFPNITNVDMSSTINQVQRVLDQVIRAVEFLFGFTLAGGAGGAVCRRQRHARGAGARVRHHARRGRRAPACCARCSAPSWPAWALLAGLLASRWPWGWAGRWRATCSSSAGPPRPGCRWPAPLAGALLALAAGWWGLRDVLRRPVVETLRRAAE
jgi:putative ABC transport system permease protein